MLSHKLDSVLFLTRRCNYARNFMRSSRGRHAAFPRSLSGFLSMGFRCMPSALRVLRQFSSWRTPDAFTQKMRRCETSDGARHGRWNQCVHLNYKTHTVKLTAYLTWDLARAWLVSTYEIAKVTFEHMFISACIFLYLPYLKRDAYTECPELLTVLLC